MRGAQWHTYRQAGRYAIPRRSGQPLVSKDLAMSFIAIGDTVAVSGIEGPSMKVESKDWRRRARCVWFVHGYIQHATFNTDILILAQP